MTSASGSFRDEGYTVPKAVNDVFGRWPAWPWSAIVAITLGGVSGATASTLLIPADTMPSSAFRWAACAGYGILLAALATVLPRAGRLLALGSALSRRPAEEASDRPWWPLPLLAAALRQTPTLRLTHQDFAAAVTQTVGEARSLLTYRLWPACVAGFVAPVLGLLSAWESGSQVELKPGEDSAAVYMRVLPQVSPPMLATISASLVLMIVLVVLDQLTKGLLQKWAAAVTLTDANSEFVQTLIGSGRTDESLRTIQDGKAISHPTSSPGEPAPPPQPKPVAKVTAEGLERLGDLFSQGR